MTTGERAEDVLAGWPDPDKVGQSEYRYIRECIDEALEDCSDDGRRDLVEAVLSEFQGWATTLLAVGVERPVPVRRSVSGPVQTALNKLRLLISSRRGEGPVPCGSEDDCLVAVVKDLEDAQVNMVGVN